ncbi:hypothetical protein [Streptomyces sp. NPDC001312]|uniref:hypothetical protein n=1 Tax=Streptomyces sp. NPDC001312 TaxID=3364561 RepID=UPI0036A9692A
MFFPTDVLTDQRTEIQHDQVRILFELDRPVYEQVDKVLKELGGRWDGRKAVRAHVFAYRIEEFMRQCLAAGEYPSRCDQGWNDGPVRPGRARRRRGGHRYARSVRRL